MNNVSLITVIAVLIVSCGGKKTEYDASGTFEAVETMVSAEAVGMIKKLNLEEGQVLEKGAIVGYIDSLQLYLKRKQLLAQVNVLLGKKPDVPLQLAALREQLKLAHAERERIANLVKAQAATQKQLDDIEGQLSVLNRQIQATESSLTITSNGLNEETSPLKIQVEQLDDQIAKCRIVNPVKGTVLMKYAEENEITATGKPLYKIADLSEIILRAYVTGSQFAGIKTGQTVKVLVDAADGNYREYSGKLEWISDKAEFTPKTIQTKDERANLVYAIKIKVKNDGVLKIGMYGEVKF
jgi:HlyD family secretion protein